MVYGEKHTSSGKYNYNGHEGNLHGKHILQDLVNRIRYLSIWHRASVHNSTRASLCVCVCVCVFPRITDGNGVSGWKTVYK